MRATGLLVVVCCCGLCGCGVAGRSEARPSEGLAEAKKPSFEKQLSASYHQTELKISNSADVLATIHRLEYEMLSHSKSVVASLGQNQKDYKTWFNMVAFDENTLTAKRKYFFVVDESPKTWLGKPRRGLMFDSEMVLEREVLDKPCAGESDRQVVILRQVSKNVRNDIGQLAQDNEMLGICGMLINQVLETVLQKLQASPVPATKLSDAGGFNFDHMTLGNGRIQMVVTDDIVKVKIRLGGPYN